MTEKEETTVTHTLLSEKARAFLKEKRFAVLATINADGTPQLTTMWYDIVGDTLLMNTAAGRFKDANLRRDPRIAICIEDGYDYITISGTAELVEDPEVALADIGRLPARYHTPAKAEQMIRDQFSKQRGVTIHLAIERVIEKL
jgi:PPOX class probable F420-dependent enzyme